MHALPFFVRTLVAGVMTSMSALSFAAPSFNFSLLHEPGVSSGYAYDINDAGDVAGQWVYATVWRNGVAQNIFGTSDGFVDVFGLNNQGDAVGYSGSGFGVATLWQGQNVVELPTPQGTRSVAVDLNDRGQIVGRYESIGSSGSPRAVVWQNNVMTELVMPDGAYASFANAVNNHGWIAGGSGSSETFSRATLWRNGVATVLPTLGGNISQANGINSLGHIVGASAQGNGNPYQYATLWENDIAIDLGTLPSFLGSSANAINDAGWIVGVSSKSLWYEDRATVWIEGDVIDLNSFLTDEEVAEGWTLRSAVGINSSGIIVGNAYNEFSGLSQIYLMTPAVPEPRTWALLLAGFAIMVLAVRLHRRA